MRNIALKLMYVGTAYHGWQIQKNAITVQEALELGISKVVKHPVRCVGAGRTDAGVHAEVYIANFRTDCDDDFLFRAHFCFCFQGVFPFCPSMTYQQ